MDGARLAVVVAAPLACLEARATASGRPVAVALTPDVPLEVLDAFGLEAALLPQVQRPSYPAADDVLQAYTCSFVRSAVETLLSGLPAPALIASTSACDALTALPSVLAGARTAVPIASIHLPVRVGTDASSRHAAAALADFCDRVAACLGRPLDRTALERAAAEREAVRVRLSALLDGLGSTVPAEDAYSAVIASQVMAPAAFLEAAAPGPAARVPAEGVPVILSGSHVASPDLIAGVEATGARVVADDTWTGMRSAGRRVARDGDLLAAIGRSLVDPLLHGPVRLEIPEARPGRVATLAKARGAKAAILLHYKFCDPHAFEAPGVLAALRDADVPGIVLELDRDEGLTERDRTRLQTLVEAVS